jgi:hypothetical protein
MVEEFHAVVSDPLSYEDFTFKLPDWSNIPSIIPKFCLHLNKHLKGIITHLKNDKEIDQLPAFKEEMIALIKVIYFYYFYRVKIPHH